MYIEHGRKAAGTAAHCSQVVWVSKIRGFIIPNSRSWLYAEWCFCIILLHMLFLQWWWYLCFCQDCRNSSIVSFPSISSFLSIAFPKFLETLKYFDNLVTGHFQTRKTGFQLGCHGSSSAIICHQWCSRIQIQSFTLITARIGEGYYWLERRLEEESVRLTMYIAA